MTVGSKIEYGRNYYWESHGVAQSHAMTDLSSSFDYTSTNSVHSFGARYFSDPDKQSFVWNDSDLSVWLSVDPLSDMYPSTSPYMYVRGNPIMLVDPNGMNDDEWNLNIETGEKTKVSDLGGKDVQIINHYRTDENGDAVHINTTSFEGAEVFTGPVAQNYSNPNFTYGASDKDLWSNVPDEYQGHYTAGDLSERYKASTRSNQSKYNSIKSQETMGLSRTEMIWNSSDAYRFIVNKYGTDASLVMAFEYDLMPMPGGAVSYSQRSLACGRSAFLKNTRGLKGSDAFYKTFTYSNTPLTFCFSQSRNGLVYSNLYKFDYCV